MLHKYQMKSFNLETVDNPGWWIEIPLSINRADREIEKQNTNEDDWFFMSIQNSSVVVSGDETKLIQCLQAILAYFNIQITKEIEAVLPYLKFLQEWYVEQCDEGWEHTYGIRVNIDMYGHCSCSIDLYGTWGYLDEQEFETVGNLDTFQCRKEGQQFIGEGELLYIIYFLKVFKEWVEQ